MPLTLRKYQREILDASGHLSAIALFMGTGTGKTLTAVERFLRNPTPNLLVVCPLSVVTQWRKTIESQAPHLTIATFKKSATAKVKNEQLLRTEGEYDVVIVNFEIIAHLPALLSLVDESWTVIVDEMHRIKAWGTRKKPVIVTRMMCAIGAKVTYKIGLTATPTQGNWGGYIDYYPQLRFLGYTSYTYEEFFERYVEYALVKYKGNYPSKQIRGYKNVSELDALLKLIAWRYVPQYGDFLPQHIRVDIERAKDYPRLVREQAITKDGMTIVLNNSGRKRVGLKTMTTGVIYGQDMVSNHYKIANNTNKIDWLKEFLMDTAEPVLIFYNYTIEYETLVKLLDTLGKTYLHVCRDSSAQIEQSHCDVYIGQYQAMAVGVDGLHLKSHMEVLFAMPESSLLYIQALGRIDRIGQTLVPMYYYLVMEDTIDADIMQMIEDKVEFSEQVLEKLDSVAGGYDETQD